MPRFSVFTPTHRSTYLLEAYQSLLAQTCADWEWVLVLNGGLTEVPPRIAADARVRVLSAPSCRVLL